MPGYALAMKLFVLTFLNGLTLASLYFLVASGFSLVFGLMRNVNLAHGSLYLLGAYIGYEAAAASGSWFAGVAAGALSMALAGVLLQVLVFRWMEGQELRQTLVTIEYERELENAVETCRKMHRRGIRVLIGGDYGFAWTPQGTNAKDLEYFVDMIGMSPMEAIMAGTRYGGQIMGMADELGQIKPGFLADMLLVDGDPLANVRILQEKNRLLAIMKDGKFYKEPPVQPQRARVAV